jgi:hypothetical protein
MRVRRPGSSVRRVSAWLIVAAGLALYGALVYVLGMADISPNLPLPWWAAQAVPPILYAIVVRLSARGMSVVRWIAATLCLWAVHVVLGALTTAFVSRAGLWSVDFTTVEALLPPALPGIFWVPLLLLPLRDLIGGRPPASAPPRRRTTDRQVGGVRHNGVPTQAPVPQHAAGTIARSGTPPQPPAPKRAPSAARPMSDTHRSRETRSSQRPLPVQRGPAVEDAHKSAAAGPVGDPASAPPPRRQAAPADDAPPDVLVRISFDRVAQQFPPGAFGAPLDRIEARLQEPGHLLIPQRLVLAQLAEGFVRAGWDVVARQFPRDVLSMTDEEIIRRLADGQLVLPLDELVPQLPADLFAPTGRAVDVERIAGIPAPFQPALSETRDRPAMPVAQAVTESPVSKAEWSFPDGERTDSRLPGVPVLEGVEPDRVLVGAADVQSESALAIDTRRLPRRGSIGSLAASPGPAWEGGAADAPTPEALPQPVEAVSERDESATRARVTALLAPLRPLAVGAESVDGTTLFTVSSSGLCSGPALAAARRLLPLIAEGRAPWPAQQLTMRGADVVLILTPLGPLDQGGPVLLCAVPPGGALASFERLSLRVAAEHGQTTEGLAAIDRDDGEEWQEPDLLDSEPPTRVHQIAGTLGAFGPVTAHILRDAEMERDLYLFLPAGSDVRMTGRFAGELDRFARTMVESGHTFHTAVLRSGRRRLIIRLDHAAAGRAAIVVAGGETDRPGLAYRQIEGAAAVLSAR